MTTFRGDHDVVPASRTDQPFPEQSLAGSVAINRGRIYDRAAPSYVTVEQSPGITAVALVEPPRPEDNA